MTGLLRALAVLAVLGAAVTAGCLSDQAPAPARSGAASPSARPAQPAPPPSSPESPSQTTRSPDGPANVTIRLYNFSGTVVGTDPPGAGVPLQPARNDSFSVPAGALRLDIQVIDTGQAAAFRQYVMDPNGTVVWDTGPVAIVGTVGIGLDAGSGIKPPALPQPGVYRIVQEVAGDLSVQSFTADVLVTSPDGAVVNSPS